VKLNLVSVVVGAALVVGGLFGTLATALAGEPAAPYCPEEDSCSVDYDGWTNSWVVTEDRL
jgi:hypothetical protein